MRKRREKVAERFHYSICKKENTAKLSLEELDTVLTAEAIAGYFQVKRNTVSYYLNQKLEKHFLKLIQDRFAF